MNAYRDMDFGVWGVARMRVDVADPRPPTPPPNQPPPPLTLVRREVPLTWAVSPVVLLQNPASTRKEIARATILKCWDVQTPSDPRRVKSRLGRMYELRVEGSGNWLLNRDDLLQAVRSVKKPAAVYQFPEPAPRLVS